MSDVRSSILVVRIQKSYKMYQISFNSDSFLEQLECQKALGFVTFICDHWNENEIFLLGVNLLRDNCFCSNAASSELESLYKSVQKTY